MKDRILSAIILVLIFVPLIARGSIFFTVLILFTGLLAFKELFDLRLKEKKLSLLVEVLAYLAVGFLIVNHYQGNELTLILDYRILTFMLFIFMVPLVMIGDNEKYNLQDALYLIGSSLFIGLSFNLMILIRNYSMTHFIYFLIITIFTDTFAYLTGTLIGKHKLAKKISPNKTVEGFIGGLVIGTFMGVLYYTTVIGNSISWIQIIGVTAVLSMIGQIGDLIFSQIKRFYLQKDFSNMIPGHGGILDLLDSLIFVVITGILFMSIL